MITKSLSYITVAIISLFILNSCFYNRNVRFFENTPAYELAKTIANNDTTKIKKLVTQDKSLLKVINTAGSTPLDLAVILENYEAFKVLLELGANPNAINPDTRVSTLMKACKFYNKPESFTIDLRFIRLLLQKGADPNYAIENEFVNPEGFTRRANSPMCKAATLDLDMLKLLIQYGGDPFKRLGDKGYTPFSRSILINYNDFDVTYYFIDSLKVNVKEPMRFYDDGTPGYIQDLVIFGNKNLLDKVRGKKVPDSLINEKRWALIQKLEKMDVDFKNHKYWRFHETEKPKR